MDNPAAKQQAELKKKHERTKQKLKIIGVIVAVAGLGLAIMGIADMVASTSEGEIPTRFLGTYCWASHARDRRYALPDGFQKRNHPLC